MKIVFVIFAIAILFIRKDYKNWCETMERAKDEK